MAAGITSASVWAAIWPVRVQGSRCCPEAPANTSPPGARQWTPPTTQSSQCAGGPNHGTCFQDGPVFRLNAGADATVLATYDNGEPAAVVAPYGSGWVGVVGPHPEADRSWYSSVPDLTNPDGIRSDLGYDFVEATVHAPVSTKPG
ncbi:MAG: hypothetical protein QOI25_5370 [Mycobacterium sp.]|nr:hypothetical protein [Mycobacterium sp.]